MMRRLLGVLCVVLVPVAAAAQTNTTGSLSANPSLTPVQSPTTTGGTTTTPTTTGTTTTPTVTTPTPSTTTAAPRDVAIVLCAQDFTAGAGRLVVFSASTSTGAPTIAPGAQCAQAISDLFVAGFGVIDVLPFNQQLQYTLVR
jgi:hypothetical protein